MSDTAIKVENLSRRYRIGLREERHPSTALRTGYTFAGLLTDFVTRPVKNLRRLRRLSAFSEDGHDPDDIIWALKDVSFERGLP